MYFDVKLNISKGAHTNITNNFNIILVYEYFSNVKNRLITPKVAHINMIWSYKSFQIWHW
jgi:hypothetical protein